MKQGLALLVAILAVPAMPSSIREQHDAGVAAHLERSLSTASAAYDDVLRLDPPREPTADEWRIIERFAPRLFTTRSEPFELRDVAAIMHPETGVIAYHFFWDEDIDFPDDNDPCDHEVVWSIPSSDRKTLPDFKPTFTVVR